FSDRTKECEVFRRILQREVSYRVIIIHSNGQKQVGKSTLLTMFNEICKDVAFIWYRMFDARLYHSWQEILDTTVTTLGKTNCADYVQLRCGTRASRRAENIRQITEPLTAASSTYANQSEALTDPGDAKGGQPKAIVGGVSRIQESYPSPDPATSTKELR